MQANWDEVVPPPEGEWPSDWMRAMLGAFALRALESGPSYGYAIISELEAAGLGVVKGGTLYPLLTRFEQAGQVSVEWRAGDGGPGRKYFALTAQGREALAAIRADWRHFTMNAARYLAENEFARRDNP